MDRAKLKATLKLEEGNKPFPYVDTVGKVTIGVGRNLTDVGLSPDEVNLLLDNDINRVEVFIGLHFPWFSSLNDVRQRVIADMCFNLGSKILNFKNFLAYMAQGAFDKAAFEMLDSFWAKQVGKRADKLSTMMRTGQE